MMFGVALPNYGRGPTKEEVVKVAALAEKLGYDSVWTTDHTLMAKAYAYPYGNLFETITTLAYIAATTSTIKLGTSILSLPLRNPILVAKQTATLDVLSNGRFILGAGVGGGEDDEYEFAYLNADYKNRGRIADEFLKVIKTLWTEEQPSFRGEFFKFSECVFLPKPLQKPHPPIWVAGNSRAALRRASIYGDGWHPTGITPKEYAEGSKLLGEISGDKPVTRSCRYLVRILKTGEAKSDEPFYTIQGDVREVVAEADRFVKAGAEHMVCYFGDDGAERTDERIRVFARDVASSF